MHFSRWLPRPGRPWWWIFGLLIAAPAIALSVLGLRAARLERIERQQQLRDRQVQLARLTDAGLAVALSRLETELAAGAAPKDAYLLSLDRQGLLLFPQERVYFGEFGLQPDFAPRRMEPAAGALAARAQAAEAQRRPQDAGPIFRRILAASPALGPWAELGLARVRYEGGDGSALALLARPEWSGIERYTPSGLPLALLACGYAERIDAPRRARFRPLLEATLQNLRAGRWWLSFDERQFHDAELRRLLALARAENPGEDARLKELAAVGRVARHSAARLPEVTRRFERLEESSAGSLLVVWAPAPQQPGSWIGAGLPQARLRGLLDGVVAPLAAGQNFGALVRDTSGRVIWSNAPVAAAVIHALPLRAVSAWEIAFTAATDDFPFAQKRLLWYGFVATLVAMLMAGLAMTARVVQREVELARLQSEFLGAVTHEFKSPITGIRLLLERIGGGRLRSPDSIPQYLAAIEQETQRLDRLVNRLLESQKLQAGRKRYNFEPASIVAVAESVVRELRPQAEAGRLVLELEVRGEIPQAELDPAAITDAIENLLDNAIKHSPPGSRIRVEIESSGGHVRVAVCDQGAGIAAEDLPRVFDRFYQTRGGRHNVGGTGLGLALVKAAAEAHGGVVEVSSTPGRGSRFVLCLPLHPPGAAG